MSESPHFFQEKLDDEGALASANDAEQPVAARSSMPTPMLTGSSPGADDYGVDKIKVLEGLDAVRKRPSMYI